MRGGDGKSDPPPDRPLKGGNGLVIENNRYAAVLADQMMVRALADHFENALIIDLRLADQPEIAQKVQRAIHRCPIDPGLLSANAGVDGVRGQMRAGASAQGVIDDLPLRRGAQAMLMEQIAQVPAVGRCGSARLHGTDRIPQCCSAPQRWNPDPPHRANLRAIRAASRELMRLQAVAHAIVHNVGR